MSKLPCEVVMDLLPLYVDDVVSDVTKQAVEEHLQTCEKCRKEAETMSGRTLLPVNEHLQRTEARMMRGIRKRFFKKKVLVAVLSVLVAVAALAGVYTYMATTEIVAPYDGKTVTVTERDGTLYATYHHETLGAASSCGFLPVEVTIDGEKKTVAGFYFYETPWSIYVEPHLPTDERATETTFALGDVDELDAVYYGAYTLDSNHPDFDNAVSQMECVWEKTS